MARVLGRLEYGGLGPDRFFIHCDTTGGSLTPLFATAAEAWRAYDAGGSDALHAAVPARSRELFVIRKTLATGRAFGPAGELLDEPLFGLATLDRLLTPAGSLFADPSRHCLLDAQGVLHVAQEVDGGFQGDFDQPVCVMRWTPVDEETRILPEERYGRPLDLCPHCVAALCNVRD